MQFKAVTRKQYIETSVAVGDAEGAASYTWAFIHSISKGDFEEHSEDLKKILGREPENLRDTIPKVFNFSYTLARYGTVQGASLQYARFCGIRADRVPVVSVT